MKKICLIALLLAVSAANCTSHPWIGQDMIKKLKTNFFTPFSITEPQTYMDLVDYFQNVNLQDQDFTDKMTLIPDTWKTNSAKTCCDETAYNNLVKLPQDLFELIAERPSKFERMIAGFNKFLAKCAKDESDGENDAATKSMKELLQRLPAVDPDAEVKDGEKGDKAIKFLKQFFQYKADMFKNWIQFTRGQLLNFCRPNDQLSVTANGMNISKETNDELEKHYSEGFTKLGESVKKLAGALQFGGKIFGSKVCANKAKSFVNKLQGNGVGVFCKGDAANNTVGDDTVQGCKNFKFKPLSIRILKPLISNAPKGKDAEEQGVLADLDKKPPKVRILAEDDAAVVDSGNTVDSIEDSTYDDTISFGGVKADGTGGEGFDESDEVYNNNGQLVGSSAGILSIVVMAIGLLVIF